MNLSTFVDAQRDFLSEDFMQYTHKENEWFRYFVYCFSSDSLFLIIRVCMIHIWNYKIFLFAEKCTDTKSSTNTWVHFTFQIPWLNSLLLKFSCVPQISHKRYKDFMNCSACNPNTRHKSTKVFVFSHRHSGVFHPLLLNCLRELFSSRASSVNVFC